MKINKNNYEAWFLDYYEGALTPQQVADLLLFVEQHPEFKKEFESFENFSLEDYSVIEFENKSSLKKEITIENKEEYFIRSVEGMLNATEKGLLDTFIEQHPQYLTELELFKKTKLVADTSVTFDNKELLKRIEIVSEESLIASVEGLLSTQEQLALNSRLISNPQLQKELGLFQQTKSIADTSVIFEDKESLKHKDRKIVPFYYYVAAAASIMLVIGLFFLFNTNQTQPEFANAVTKPIQNTAEHVSSPPLHTNTQPSVKLSDLSVSVVKKNHKPAYRTGRSEVIIPNTEAVNDAKQEQKEVKEPENIEQAVVASTKIMEEKPEESQEFLSLKEVVATKIKEKNLNPEMIEKEKKNENFKKINGWDIAQFVAKGFNKITGKKVEVNPTYNEAGEVTAYAVDAGIVGFSRVR